MDQEHGASAVNIYAYDDFRLYLKDRYEAMQRSNTKCSARGFARKAGFSNPGFFNDVIKGRRTLSEDSCVKLAKVFDLEEREAEYFDLLVAYDREKKDPVRQELYRKILFRRNRSGFARLNPAQSRYFQDYRYPLVYHALMAFDFRGDCERLSNFIYPSIPAGQIAKCIENLCEWGLVVGGKHAQVPDHAAVHRTAADAQGTGAPPQPGMDPAGCGCTDAAASGNTAHVDDALLFESVGLQKNKGKSRFFQRGDVEARNGG